MLHPEIPPEGLCLREVVERFESDLIRQALERTGGNKNRAARLIQMNRTTLFEKMKRRGVDRPGIPEDRVQGGPRLPLDDLRRNRSGH